LNRKEEKDKRTIEKYWIFLVKLAQLGAFKKPIFTSTTKLTEHLGYSQQTISRILKKLSVEGYLERKIDVRGEHLKLTSKSVEELRKLYGTLTRILYPSKPAYLTLKGKLFTGFGEGAYYVTRNGYLKQFTSKLGFKPYPGTLNLKLLGQADLLTRKELENFPGIVIEGFSNGQRTYGALKCFPTLVNCKVKGALLLIQRTHYNSSVVEVIAPVYLRKKLGIKDGDIVTLKVNV